MDNRARLEREAEQVPAQRGHDRRLTGPVVPPDVGGCWELAVEDGIEHVQQALEEHAPVGGLGDV